MKLNDSFTQTKSFCVASLAHQTRSNGKTRALPLNPVLSNSRQDLCSADALKMAS